MFDCPLERITESPLERERVGAPLLLQKMESMGLQLPPAGGTKSRAIQQAKEMAEFVAERAKRGDEEAPPYEFCELIGKGAYGRVFKGCVYVDWRGRVG